MQGKRKSTRCLRRAKPPAGPGTPPYGVLLTCSGPGWLRFFRVSWLRLAKNQSRPAMLPISVSAELFIQDRRAPHQVVVAVEATGHLPKPLEAEQVAVGRLPLGQDGSSTWR